MVFPPEVNVGVNHDDLDLYKVGIIALGLLISSYKDMNSRVFQISNEASLLLFERL